MSKAKTRNTTKAAKRPRMSAADRQRHINHLHSGVELSNRIIQAIDGVLFDAAIDARESKRADAALIVWAALSRLKVETGAALLHAAQLHNDAQGGAA